MSKYEVFELDKIKEMIKLSCSSSLGIEWIDEEEVAFEYLKIKRDLARSKEMLEIVIRYGDLPFGGIRDIRQALHKANIDTILTPYELVSVADHSDGVSKMQKHFKELEKTYPDLQDIIDSLASYPKIALAIRGVFTSSNEISDNASTTLKNIRMRLKKVESSIHTQLERFINSNSSSLMDNVVAYRNERSVVFAKISEKNSIKGIVHGESMSGQTAYVEPECVISLNNELQSLRSLEQEEIERILYELSQLVKGVSEAFYGNCKSLALIDGIHAKAKWGKKQNACIPLFTKENDTLYIHLGRHPLIDRLKVVANTISLNNGKRVLLITGPNTGGKSVTLKTIGLFTLMTYMAIPLPCEEAQIGFYDEIYVDLGDEQSISSSLSTFSAHLTKLAQICDYATRNSLVLIDEFGSGTDPKEGEALAIAILNHMRKMKTTLIATTHFGRLKLYGMKHDDIEMSQVEFDMEKLSPTFRFIQGSTGQSNALDIALRFGIKEGIVKDAINIKVSAMSEEEKLNAKLEILINENEVTKHQLELELEDARIKNRAIVLRLEAVEIEKERLQIKAQKEIESYIEDTKLQADLILEELKDGDTTRKLHENIALRSSLNVLVKKTDESSAKVDEALKVGDYVEILSLNKVGQIESLDKKNEATIMLHGTKIKMKISNLKKTNNVQKPKAVASKGYGFKQMLSVSMECNLIGKRVDEALVIMDKYLDNAILANLNSVRIIHGHGTGALRSAVHEKLKIHSKVDNFRLGQGNEGGVGATVVFFKSK